MSIPEYSRGFRAKKIARSPRMLTNITCTICGNKDVGEIVERNFVYGFRNVIDPATLKSFTLGADNRTLICSECGTFDPQPNQRVELYTDYTKRLERQRLKKVLFNG